MDGMPEGMSRVPFPILPPAIQICSLLGALYPHFDIGVDDDSIKIVSGRAQLDQSLHALAIGSCLSLLGFYCCQFVTSIALLRREYLGILALLQAAHLILLVARMVMFPDSIDSDPLGTAFGLWAAALVALLLLAERKAYAAPAAASSTATPQPAAKAAGRWRLAVKVTTHALWLAYAVWFLLPTVGPYLLPVAMVPVGRPYGTATTVLAHVVALARARIYLSGRIAAGKVKVA